MINTRRFNNVSGIMANLINRKQIGKLTKNNGYRSVMMLKLSLKEFHIMTAFLNQLLMRTRFQDLTMIQNYNPVGIQNSR